MIDTPGGAARFARDAEAVHGCPSLEVAAQAFCRGFFERFADTLLVRVFATVPFAELPPAAADFARAFAMRGGGRVEPEAGDTILALFGTHGVEPAWCRRDASVAHLAIPLLSGAFVAEIPMLARMLGEFGFASAPESGWHFLSRFAGDALFFVDDVPNARDDRGRLVVPATDFVEQYGVRTAFGFGGPVGNGAMLLSTIVFTTAAVSRETAAAFVPLVMTLRAATADAVEARAFFR